MKSSTQTRPFSLSKPILSDKTYVDFYDSNSAYIEEHFKRDWFYPYFKILSLTDSKVGIRRDKLFPTFFLTLPGHIFRSTNYTVKYICGYNHPIEPTKAIQVIENKLTPIKDLGYIDFSFEKPHYVSYWFDSVFGISNESRFCHIHIADYDSTLKVPPTFVLSKKKGIAFENGQIVKGNIKYRVFNDDSKKPISVLVPAIFSKKHIKPSFTTTQFQEDNLPIIPQKSAEKFRNDYFPVIKSVFNSRAHQNEQKFSKLEAFLDIYAHTVLDDPKYPLSFIAPIIIIDGHLLLSYKKLAAHWNWDAKTVKRFFENNCSFFKVIEISSNHDKLIFNTGIFNTNETNASDLLDYIETSLKDILSHRFTCTSDVLSYLYKNKLIL